MSTTICEATTGYCIAASTHKCAKCSVTQCLLNSVCVDIPEDMCLGY